MDRSGRHMRKLPSLLLRVRHYWWRVHWVYDITGWKADEVEYEGLRSLSISAALSSKSHCILIALIGSQRVARILPFIDIVMLSDHGFL